MYLRSNLGRWGEGGEEYKTGFEYCIPQFKKQGAERKERWVEKVLETQTN